MTTTIVETETFVCITRDKVTGSEAVREFPSRMAARECAKSLRDWNPVDWPCGRNLEIIVARVAR